MCHVPAVGQVNLGNLAGSLPPTFILVGKTEWPHVCIMWEVLGKRKEKYAEASQGNDISFVQMQKHFRVKGVLLIITLGHRCHLGQSWATEGLWPHGPGM